MKLTDDQLKRLHLSATVAKDQIVNSMGGLHPMAAYAGDVVKAVSELIELRRASSAPAEQQVIFVATSLPTLQEMRIPVVTMAFGPDAVIPTDPALRSALAENVGQRAIDTVEKLRTLRQSEEPTSIQKNLS